MTYGLGNQLYYPAQAGAAYPGLVKQRIRANTGINAAGFTQQVVTIDIGTAADATAYTVGVGNVSVTYTSGTGATATDIRDGLLASLRTNSIIASKFLPAVVDADTFTLTHRQYGFNEVVTVSGGGTGFAATNVASATSSSLPYGLVVAAKTSYALVNGVPTVGVPTASGDVVLGIGMASRTIPKDTAAQTEAAYRNRDLVNILAQGVIWAVAEAAIAFTDTLYYRYAASGGLTTLGAIAAGSGTGLAALTGARADGPSVTLSDGVIVVPVAINLP